MGPGSDEIEQRLTAAAQAVREQERCRRQRAELGERERTAATELGAARVNYDGAEREIGRLEHLSLTRVLAALHGSREDALAREQAQAEAARYRIADAQHRLAVVRDELAAVERRQAELDGADWAYEDALAAKERYLTSSADPRGRRLLALAEERGGLMAELGGLHRAGADAEAAADALAEVQDRLGSAASWSTYDTYFNHGMIANSVKHDRIDQAAEAARAADLLLARLRSDAEELSRLEPTAPALEIGGGFRFADIFFNNIVSDLAVGRQIRDAQDNVDEAVEQVGALQDRLTEQIAAATARLAAIDAEREQLLAP
jgi:hypothetical protein